MTDINEKPYDRLKNALHESAALLTWYYKEKYDKKKQDEEIDVSEAKDTEDKDYRKVIQGQRNTKYLKRARFYADSPEVHQKKDALKEHEPYDQNFSD